MKFVTLFPSDEEDDDEQVIEGMSLVNYKKLSDPQTFFGWDLRQTQLEKTDSEDAAIDINLSVDIHADEEIEDEEVEEEEEDFLAQPDQEFASAETAVNGTRKTSCSI